MNNLPRVVARIVPRLKSNPRPLDHESSALTTTSPRGEGEVSATADSITDCLLMQCWFSFRVLDESRDLKFSYREIKFWKINIPSKKLPRRWRSLATMVLCSCRTIPSLPRYLCYTASWLVQPFSHHAQMLPSSKPIILVAQRSKTAEMLCEFCTSCKHIS